MPSSFASLRIYPCVTFTICFIFSLVKGYSQTGSKRLLGSFIYGKNAFNYEFTMEAHDSYSFAISSISHLSANGGDTAESLFNEFSQNVFEAIFIDQMKVKFGLSDSLVRKAATEVFFKIKARLDFIDDEPVTAYMILKKDTIWSLLRANSSHNYTGALSQLLVRHKIHRVEAETEDGALKNISVYAVDPKDSGNVSPRQFLLFKNQFPISISGKFDYEKISKINLYCFNCNGIDGLSRYIRLADLVILDIIYENDKEDYSPSNRTFSLTPGKPIVELRKEKRSKLLEVAAFSDFIGLDRNEPNGLIQIEVKRKININTKYFLLVGGKKSEIPSQVTKGAAEKPDTIKKANRYTDFKIGEDTVRVSNMRFKSVYFSYFNYLEPRLLFAKLEENNRLLDSAKAGNNTINPITLYQYQLASFGVRLQLFRLSFPQIKLQWNVLDAGAYWSRTRVALSADSTGPSAALNSIYWQFGTAVVFRPDNRWGASLGLEYLKPQLWNDDYQLANSKGLFQQQFDAWLRTGDEGRLFFRYRWTYQNDNRNLNFTQMQLGYSLHLFVGNRSAKEGKNE